MSKRGMTLVEVMIGVLLSSLVLGAAYQIWSASRRNFVISDTRQRLQNEIRTALDQLALDLKSIKAGTLDVTGSQDGTNGIIKFKRFSTNTNANQLDSQAVVDVKYEFKQPLLIRTVAGQGSHILCSHLKSFSLSRGAEPTEQMPDGMQQTAEARIDIAMTGSMKTPITNEEIEHIEKTTVIMRNEFAAASVGKHSITMAALSNAAENMIGPEGEAAVFSAALTRDSLMAMTDEQLKFMMQRETDSLENAKREIDKTNEDLSGVDAKGSAIWWNPLTWGGTDSEVSKIQEKLVKDDKLEEVNKDVQALRDIINKNEETFLKRSLEKSGTSLPTKNEELNAYHQAYDLMVKDKALKEAYEKNPQKDADGKEIPYKSLLENCDVSKMKRGEQADGTKFTESEAEFQQRREEAKKIQEAASKMDLSWMDEGSAKDEVKQYNAAKQLVDMAVVKQSYMQARDLAQTNISMINDETSNRK